jgi:hypothetical protein
VCGVDGAARAVLVAPLGDAHVARDGLAHFV